MTRLAHWYAGPYQVSRVIVGALVGLVAAAALEEGSPRPVSVVADS